MSFCVSCWEWGKGPHAFVPKKKFLSYQLHSEFLAGTPGSNYSETTMFAYVVLQFRRHFSPSATILPIFQQCTVNLVRACWIGHPYPIAELSGKENHFRAIKVVPTFSHFSRLCCRAALELVLFCWNMSLTVFQVLGASAILGEFAYVFSFSLFLSNRLRRQDGKEIPSTMYRGTYRLTIFYV